MCWSPRSRTRSWNTWEAYHLQLICGLEDQRVYSIGKVLALSRYFRTSNPPATARYVPIRSTLPVVSCKALYIGTLSVFINTSATTVGTCHKCAALKTTELPIGKVLALSRYFGTSNPSAKANSCPLEPGVLFTIPLFQYSSNSVLSLADILKILIEKKAI